VAAFTILSNIENVQV